MIDFEIMGEQMFYSSSVHWIHRLYDREVQMCHISTKAPILGMLPTKWVVTKTKSNVFNSMESMFNESCVVHLNTKILSRTKGSHTYSVSSSKVHKMSRILQWLFVFMLYTNIKWNRDNSSRYRSNTVTNESTSKTQSL